MPSQTGYFEGLKNAAGKVFTYLASITLTGTDGKTITVTQDTSLDEAVAMSSKAPKASPTFTTKITTPIVDLTGGQIAFPSAQAASANANTLDDYEEGTFTPGVSFGGGTTGVTYAGANAAYYTKIGRLVHIIGVMALSNKGSDTGAALITGLPFTCGSIAQEYAIIPLSPSAVSFDDMVVGQVNVGTTTMSLNQITNAGAATVLDNTDFVNTSTIRFSGIYMVAT